MELWELTARERIRDSLATYNWSGDALRIDDLLTAFCEDGVLEIRGRDPLEGRAAIEAFFRDRGDDSPISPHGHPTIVRHHLANTRFERIEPSGARVSSYFAVHTDIGLDHYGRYRDDFVPVGERWLIRHRFVSTDWRAEDSLMAAPDSVPSRRG